MFFLFSSCSIEVFWHTVDSWWPSFLPLCSVFGTILFCIDIRLEQCPQILQSVKLEQCWDYTQFGMSYFLSNFFTFSFLEKLDFWEDVIPSVYICKIKLNRELNTMEEKVAAKSQTCVKKSLLKNLKMKKSPFIKKTAL